MVVLGGVIALVSLVDLKFILLGIRRNQEL
jgi:hypothetical protein